MCRDGQHICFRTGTPQLRPSASSCDPCVPCSMQTLPYQQAFDRIRADYLEMPGMHLTAAQVARLSGIDRTICTSVLEDLVRSGFLCRCSPDSYRRITDAVAARAR